MNHEGWGLIRLFSKQRLQRTVGTPPPDSHLCRFEFCVMETQLRAQNPEIVVYIFTTIHTGKQPKCWKDKVQIGETNSLLTTLLRSF